MDDRGLALAPDLATAPRVRQADHDLERTVLGAALLSPDAHAVVESLLVPDDFDLSAHREIAAALAAVAERGTGAADVVALRHELIARGRLRAAGGDAALAALTEGVATTAHVERHARTLRGLAITRRIADAGRAIEVKACDPRVRLGELLELATSAVYAATSRTADTGPVGLGQAVEESLNALDARGRDANASAGQGGTGLAGIDGILTGRRFRGGLLYVLAARPGIGKSALAAALARHVAGTGKPVLFVSLEMSRQELADRLICAEARVDGRRFEANTLSPDEVARIPPAAAALYGLPLHIDDSPACSLVQLRAKVARQVRRGGCGLLVLDYLQLVTVPGAESREQAVGAVSRALKSLAKEFDVPVLAVAAMNRDAEKRSGDKRPIMSDLRESGSIESDADLVAFLYRDELVNPKCAPEDKGVAEFIVRKQRGGVTGTVRLRFDGPTTRFEDLPEQDAGYRVGRHGR